MRNVVIAASIAVASCIAAQAKTIETAVVGAPGNSPDYRYDASGVGGVASTFRIGMTEVTNSQYVEFLNAVAKSDHYELYSPNMETWRGGILRSGSPGNYSYKVKDPVSAGQGPDVDHYFEKKPVNFVSWYDALRFTNWLHNGKGGGDTETGAYTLIGGQSIPSNANSISRNSTARWWLPSEDEWYKSAYYEPSSGEYFDYPTSSNSPPDNNWPANDTGSSANYSHPDRFNWDVISDVGAYQLSVSPSGTFDQGGNVFEWLEEAVGGGRMVRGGAWYGSDVTALKASTFYNPDPLYQAIGDVGFRVATQIPEPQSIGILATAVAVNARWLSARRLRRPQG